MCYILASYLYFNLCHSREDGNPGDFTKSCRVVSIETRSRLIDNFHVCIKLILDPRSSTG